MEANISKTLFLQCEIRARFLQIARHIPMMEDKARRNHYGKREILSIEDGRNVLIKAIQEGRPYMAARFGTSEGGVLHEYCKKMLHLRKGEIPAKNMNEICTYSGFFPSDFDLLNKFCEREIKACADLDMLGVMNFVGEEWIARTFCKQATLLPASGLSSASKGWTWVLENKKVLVVHPFADTIMKQYCQHREEIFPGSNALPKFDLKCVKAVQTIADASDDRFSDWFEALDYMTEKIKEHDFDIALIGCGAYGFQLASRVKNMGKIAVHMGGALQTLFGIKGSRWEKKYNDMYNDAWVYPSEDETPKGYEKVEGGCYWSK